MGTPKLRGCGGAVTGSYWDLPDDIVPCPNGDGHLMLCRVEGQGGLFWYLFIGPKPNEHCVVVSEDCFGFDAEEGLADSELPIHCCAFSFEEFVYREWIEQFSAYHQLLAIPLTSRQEEYLDFYRPLGDTSDRRPRCKVHDAVLHTGHHMRLAKNGNWDPDDTFPLRVDQCGTRETPNANLCTIHSWMVGGREQHSVGDTAYCPSCRTEFLEALYAGDGLGPLVDAIKKHVDESELRSE